MVFAVFLERDLAVRPAVREDRVRAGSFYEFFQLYRGRVEQAHYVSVFLTQTWQL